MPLKHAFAMIIAALSACASQARAGASLFVDDAAITAANRCQIEAWARVDAPGREFTAVPACTRVGTEFSLGVSQYARPSRGPLVNLGLKQLFRDFDAHAWGMGVALGATWNGTRHRYDGWNFNLPASVALTADRNTAMHLNLGWNAPRDVPGALTGGIGFEHGLGDRWLLLAEAYGDHRGGRGAQFGLRRSFGASASLDVLVGDQHGLASAPWVTLGVNVLL